MTKSTKSRAAQFVARRIYELQSRKTQAEIASAAGFNSAGMISMIATGKAKLPLERAVSLAAALECDPALLVRLALEQTLTQPLLDQIFAPEKAAISSNERSILDHVRDVSEGTDPELTDKLAEAIVDAIDPTSLVPSRAATYAVSARLLTLEVSRAQRELVSQRQLTMSASVRVDRIEARLATIKVELDLMVENSRGR